MISEVPFVTQHPGISLTWGCHIGRVYNGLSLIHFPSLGLEPGVVRVGGHSSSLFP